jgi:rubrerythrin
VEVVQALDFAMQLELDGKAFYLAQAEKMEDLTLKVILEELALDEERHYQFVKQIKESGIYDYEGGTIIDRQPDIFPSPGQERLEKEKYSSYIAVYEQAIEFEEKSRDLYGDLAREAKSDGEREAFLMLQREEEAHRTLLWRLLQFLQRPEEWYPYI